MKRLFQVNNPDGKIVRDHEGAPAYFNDKQSAKDCRNSLNGFLLREGIKGNVYTISYGPDHTKYKGK